MMKIFRKKEKEQKSILQTKEITKPVKEMTFEEVLSFMQEEMMKNSKINNEEISYDAKQRTLSLAMSRNREAINKARYYILETLKENNIKVPGFTLEDLAYKIFAKNWGLDGLEEYAVDNVTDEIRVNGAGKDKIRIIRNGVPEKIDFEFNSDDEIITLIKRMIVEDMGASIDMSSPKLESVLSDGSRLTATCPPITKPWTFVLRRPDSFKPTLENYIERETLNSKVWKAISILARGRASMLISGNVGAGKTTFMRKVVGELNEKLRIGVIGKDSEVLLQYHYPDRDIIELGEQGHLGIHMKDLFVLMLRESPDVLIIEEFRGAGEAIEAVRACTRGLDGSMATAHFNTAEEAVEGTALF
ncbi:ATPase, T2SS/T4P/T4SS family, partial [Proteiniborus sp. DW1]|uniref:ATPase, T2SS/T4P/T4SS family n=1 Tax=Proteiniborus sp. DW1 TaxID=1889883 RepID=UPI0009424AAB